ncbi:response regulator [Halovulum dunhuangense]|uniref:Response regulator n=1 Tax=Halovulum dunhuangense TaxID=1505036 RepID=A0A849KZ74_9RHOB|nr:response regulator [Halovulum dunhuangense]NNU79322.1 response regulator [Halovulum dunhuangense]
MAQRVLIVEDEPNIADALRFLLTHEGFEVVVESDGALAMERVADSRADVVILDVMLPNRSGFDILRDLRALGPDQTPRPPVLMLTAKGQAQDRRTAAELGVTEFMTKPFSNAEVVATVKRLAGQ